MKKIILEPRQQMTTNTISLIVRVIAILTYVSGFICGMIFGNGGYRFLWSVAFPIWIVAFVSGTMILALAEIVSLLDRIANQSYEATIFPLNEDGRKSEPETHDTNAAQERNDCQEVAVMDTRPQSKIVCPLCKEEQPANRKVCWNCGCKFVFKDEQ